MIQVSKQRYGSPYLWPLNVIIPWRKQRAVRRYLAGLGWAQKSMDEVSMAYVWFTYHSFFID